MDYLPTPNFVESAAAFELRTAQIPVGALPVVDEGSDVVIGYRYESATGVFRYYDLGLESPPIDPLDLVLIGAVAARVVIKGATTLLRPASRAAMTTALRVSAAAVSSTITAAMRTALKGLSAE